MPLTIKRDSKLKSSLHLTIIQIGLYLIPLISSPYVIHVVGLEKFGKYAFFQAVIGVLSVCISYGFIQSGVKDISTSKNINQINIEFSAIFYSKLIGLLFAVLIALSLLMVDKFWLERDIYLWSLLLLLRFFLDASYVFQGIERLKDYAFTNVAGSFLVVVFLLMIIRDETDYIFLPIVFHVPRIAASLASYYILSARFKIAPVYFDIRNVANKMKSNFMFFLSNVFIIIYSKTTTILLGVLVSDTAVGAFAIAEQLMSAYNNIQGNVSAVYYPQVVKGFTESLRKGEAIARECIFLMLILSISAVVFTQFFAYELIFALFGTAADEASLAFKIISFNLISIQLSSILGIQILLTLRGSREILLVSIWASLFNVAIGYFLIHHFQLLGAVLSVTIVEFLIAIYYSIIISRLDIHLVSRGMVQGILKFLAGVVVLAAALKMLLATLPVGSTIGLGLVIIIYIVMVPLYSYGLGIIDLRRRLIVVAK